MDDLNGKVAFVTGGASGIGFGMATRFAERGMRLVLADIEKPALDAAVSKLEAGGAEVLGVHCDVADADSMTDAADAAEQRFGPVHVLCNNAGVSPFGTLDDHSLEDWQWGLGINLMGVIHGIRTFLPRMKAHGQGGHVVNTASIGGMLALPALGIYTASKYAVVGITETLSGEAAPFGIGASVLCPSFVRTRLGESGRNRPSELGEMGESPQFVIDAIASGMDPLDVGDAVVDAIQEGKLYIFTHADSKLGIKARFDAILAAFD